MTASPREQIPPPIATDSSAAPPRLDRLELQATLIQHLEWCVQFNDHLGQVRPGEPEPVRTLPGVQDCDLGRWLRAARERAPGQHPRFAELVKAHQTFHMLADEVLRLAGEDRMDLASTLLNTEFERARSQIVQILREMQKG